MYYRSPTERVLVTKQNPVTYAEETLGVHVPWAEAQDRLALHANATARVASAKTELRILRASLDMHKMNARNLAPSMENWPEKVKDQEQFVRDVVARDTQVQYFETQIVVQHNNLDEAESDERHHRLGLEVLSSRMTELGGLLHFYAEVKRAETEMPVYVHETSGPIQTTQEHTQV